GIIDNCDFCHSDITHTVRIKCAATGCEEVDLCPSCFCKGKEAGKHKRWHPYKVVEQHSYPIFTESWGADEELLLIEGLTLFGLGNWQDAAEHVGTRTREECEQHYLEVWVGKGEKEVGVANKVSRVEVSPSFFLSTRSKKLIAVWLNLKFEIDSETFQSRKKRRIEEMRTKTTELPNPQNSKPLVSAPTNHEIGGFMPGRLDFEHELHDEAENAVKDMEFGLVFQFGGDEQPGDEDVNVLGGAEVKVKEGGTSTSTTTTREDVGVGDGGNAVASGSDYPEDQDDLELKLVVLDIYNDKLDRRKEAKNILFQRGLMEHKKIQAAERKKPQKERDLVAKYKVFAKLQTAEDHEAFIEGLLYEQTLRTRIAQLQTYRSKGITTVAEAESYEAQLEYRVSRLFLPLLARNSRSPSRFLNESRRDESADFSTRRFVRFLPLAAAPLNLASAASLHLLSPPEQELCSTLRILPKPYLMIKETLIREYARRGGNLRRREARALVKIDVNKTARIWDLMEEMGVFRAALDPESK
ncbi:hypothetical protein BDY24DRAFT_331249, partial [Mrakia frigida]|uniref:uncharacterized protein n=1 Tax=Mrakia frigida TaxID=29902 RepID=UPI003FCC0F7F